MSTEAKRIDAVRVVMNGPQQRVAILREMRIADTQLAAKAIGKKQLNQVEMQIALQNELLKLLLLQIDDKKLDHTDKNNLDNLLSVVEYRCLLKVIEKLSGDEESGEAPELEITSI